jgi:hypothetical protein
VYNLLASIYAALAIFATIVVINVHHKQRDDKPPPWLNRLCDNVSRTFSMCTNIGCLADAESGKEGDDRQQVSGVPVMQVKGQVAKNNERGDIGSTQSGSRQPVPLQRRASVASHETDSPEGDEMFSEWHRVAILLDRFFFWLFLAVILLTTIICFAIFPYINRIPPPSSTTN